MKNTNSRLEQEYMQKIEQCNQSIEDAKKRNDTDAMIKAIKEYQMWREKLFELHDAQIKEIEQKLVSGI